MSAWFNPGVPKKSDPGGAIRRQDRKTLASKLKGRLWMHLKEKRKVRFLVDFCCFFVPGWRSKKLLILYRLTKKLANGFSLIGFLPSPVTTCGLWSKNFALHWWLLPKLRQKFNNAKPIAKAKQVPSFAVLIKDDIRQCDKTGLLSPIGRLFEAFGYICLAQIAQKIFKHF